MNTAIGRIAPVQVTPRGRGLRREWTRAFAIMLGLLLLAASMAIAGVWGVVEQVSGSARHLRQETALIASLQTDITNHEEVGHKLLSDEVVNRASYVDAQNGISLEFARAARLFPTANGMRATVLEAERSWQSGLTTYGLWSSEVKYLHGDHEAENPLYGASSDGSVALVDGLQAPALLALDQGLAHGEDLKTALVAVLSGLFGLALGTTAYFRRRLVKDLLEPVANLRHGVSQLHAGDYDHRIEIVRSNEIGDLTEAFNVMADALNESHAMLTLRATHDSLTGLANRAAFTERLAASFNAGSDRRRRQESVLFIDVDDFKEVNDSLGHEGGDLLLEQLGARLKACVRPYDLVARLGGDEFAIVIAQDQGGRAASEVATRILAALRTPFDINHTRLTVSVSIGVAQRMPETANATELMRRADFAMYMAKGGGKGQYRDFDLRAYAKSMERSALRADLAHAASNGELRIAYQPIFNIRTQEILGVEALLRWQHPTLGLIPPADFIGLAEESGDINSLGCWVLRTAIDEVAHLRHALPSCEAMWVSVNLSPAQLGDQASMAAINAILAHPDVEAEYVVLEVTESALASEIRGVRQSLDAMRQTGVRVAVDDFGTGFSTLATLAALPADILKIDRSFVSAVAPTAAAEPMLDAILGLAEKLSLAVIAEGIETAEQLDLLRRLGCRMGQGYFLARPIPADQLESRLARGDSAPASHTP